MARAAKVSLPTVSRVANGGAGVGRETQERVRNAAQVLGVDLYRKNKAKVIGFVFSNRDMLHPFHSRVLFGAETYCASRGYNLLFVPFNYSADAPARELRLPQIFYRHDVIRALIIADTNSQNLLELLGQEGIPFSVLGNNVLGEWRPEEYDVVWFDDVQGAYEMTRHLLLQSHRDIWYVGNCQLPWFARRCEGYRRAMLEAGMTVRVSSLDSEKNEETGYLATKSILLRDEPVTAIFAGDDSVAQGVYEALREYRLGIPQDISVVGVNDVLARVLHPALSSLKVFPEHVGKQLAELVLNRIAHPDMPPQHSTIPTQLAKRQSSHPLTLPSEVVNRERAQETP
ncbi:MAG: hypothetical protein AUH86_20755 [Acidobacteria bacterium 13_1_40CM_4_58_4]|nr:MAG: hypothetical protein AUH86_20755 [Acidobacteria bacterium 13_1_40CM_4_58_4]